MYYIKDLCVKLVTYQKTIYQYDMVIFNIMLSLSTQISWH